MLGRNDIQCHTPTLRKCWQQETSISLRRSVLLRGTDKQDQYIVKEAFAADPDYFRYGNDNCCYIPAAMGKIVQVSEHIHKDNNMLQRDAMSQHPSDDMLERASYGGVSELLTGEGETSSPGPIYLEKVSVTLFWPLGSRLRPTPCDNLRDSISYCVILEGRRRAIPTSALMTQKGSPILCPK